MAIKLIANYSKRLGLPGFSSHQYSVSVETELVATADIPAESARLYRLLQSDVDSQMQNTGFVPPLDYGMEPSAPAPDSSARTRPPVNARGTSAPRANGAGPMDGHWKCSDKQRDLILRLVDEHQLDKHGIEALAVERFGHGVRILNKLEASGLIDELLERHGGTRQAPPRSGGTAYRGRGAGKEAA
ncbi:MAG: hypothetical protein J0M04_08475 [Verrucomicrobia bacterium]|nr:hypothetical protein [Verrucomicrobiota bacterium]